MFRLYGPERILNQISGLAGGVERMEEQMYTLFTTEGCPKCRILEEKMTKKALKFAKCMNPKEMQELKIVSVPTLKCPDGTMLSYHDAVKLVNSLPDQTSEQA